MSTTGKGRPGGTCPGRPPGIVVDENSAGVNFELVERLAEPEEAERLPQQLKKRQAHRRGTPRR